MKLCRAVMILALSSASLAQVSPAGASEDLDAVLVSRGEHALTLRDMDARMSRFPEHERAQFARDPANLGRLMDRLLFDEIMASEAREMGLDKDPQVRRDLELAMQEVLAIHRMNRLFSENLPDFRMIAEERYLADPSRHVHPAVLIVEHVLISTRERSDEEASALAEQVRARAQADSDGFAALVAEFSDDPSKSTNNGRIDIDDPEKYVPEFVAAAQALKQVGEISAPVKTEYGYHVLRLVESKPPVPKTFAEVEENLVRMAEHDYRENVRRDYRSTVRSRHEETGNEALLITLPARYGGRPEATGSGD